MAKIPTSNQKVKSGPLSKSPAVPQSDTLEFARIAAFSGLIIVGTILSNVLFGFPLPPPLYEITAAPAFYMAISVLFSRKVSFWSTAIGSGLGEAVSIFLFGLVPGAFALTYIPGIILARSPEALIINWFRRSKSHFLIFAMIVATIYEAVAFFLVDWPVYSLTSFYCTTPPCGSNGLVGGFWLAALDFGTLIDIVWIPVALALIVAVRRAFKIEFFG